MDTTLGPVVTADEVCAAVEATLRAWMPTAIEALGISDSVDPPHDYKQLPTAEALRSADLPACGISSPGFADAPIRDEDGNLLITWRVVVVAYMRGADYAETQSLTRTYAAAIRTILVQQKTLLGFANGTELISEGYEPVNDGARTLGGAILEIDVQISDAVNDMAAADGLPPVPLPAPVVADEIDITVARSVTS